MQPYFVFDLRGNQFAAGVLENFAGKLQWKHEMVQVWQRENIYDSVNETGLCFFRRPPEKSWKPISITALSQLPDTHEKIANLFDEPDSQLRSILGPALGSLLKPFINKHEGLEMLFLVDSIQIKELLGEVVQKLKRPYQILVKPDAPNTFAGFALLNVEQDKELNHGRIVSCQVQGKLHGYRWTGADFGEIPSTNMLPESQWESRDDLERVGMVAFEMIWSNNFISEKTAQLEKVKKENESLHLFLAQVENICSKLQELSIVFVQEELS
jgi:hypothetical protein